MTAEYRMSRLHRPLVLGILGFFAIVAAGFMVGGIAASTAGAGAGPVVIAALWVAIVGWASYLLLFRFAYRVEVVDGNLRWWAPLRRGSAPLSALTAIRPYLLGSRSAAIFTFTGASSVLVIVRRGFPEFATQVHTAAPQAELNVSGWIQGAGRRPGSSSAKGSSGAKGSGTAKGSTGSKGSSKRAK